MYRSPRTMPRSRLTGDSTRALTSSAATRAGASPSSRPRADSCLDANARRRAPRGELCVGPREAVDGRHGRRLLTHSCQCGQPPRPGLRGLEHQDTQARARRVPATIAAGRDALQPDTGCGSPPLGMPPAECGSSSESGRSMWSRGRSRSSHAGIHHIADDVQPAAESAAEHDRLRQHHALGGQRGERRDLLGVGLGHALPDRGGDASARATDTEGDSGAFSPASSTTRCGTSETRLRPWRLAT